MSEAKMGIISDAPITEKERDMEIDYTAFASFFILQQWNAVFLPDKDKISRKERVDAFHFFTDVSGYWAKQRKIWAEEYLKTNGNVFRNKFLKHYHKTKFQIDMPVAFLRKESADKLKEDKKSYDNLCKEIKKEIRYFHTNTLFYKDSLPILMENKKTYDRVFRATRKEHYIDNLGMKCRREVKPAEYFFEKEELQKWI